MKVVYYDPSKTIRRQDWDYQREYAEWREIVKRGDQEIPREPNWDGYKAAMSYCKFYSPETFNSTEKAELSAGDPEFLERKVVLDDELVKRQQDAPKWFKNAL